MENSVISWTDHTFNPWWGCIERDPACDNCYARLMAKRYGFDIWGPDKPRRELSEANWRKPLKWNREAAEGSGNAFVFCASMADILEDHETPSRLRPRVWDLIEQTPNLTWLLLTKRPENWLRFAPSRWLTGGWPCNAWAMTTTANQRYFDLRWPIVAELPSPVLGFSVEPMLGPVSVLKAFQASGRDPSRLWVITGGESGCAKERVRKYEVDWFRNLRDECVSLGVPFHLKQWGNWAPGDQGLDWSADPHRRTLDGLVWDQRPEPIRKGTPGERASAR